MPGTLLILLFKIPPLRYRPQGKRSTGRPMKRWKENPTP